jgi:uncharacterized protein (TIGR03435 family)
MSFFRCGAGVMFAGFLCCSQAWAAGPEFEVATVKAAPQPTPDLFRSGKIHIGMTVDGARVDVGGMPLTALLTQAFRVKAFQVVAPDWARESRWDILAKLPDGDSKDQIPEMLQALLAERFKLAVHSENKELPVYALVVAKGGPKLKASEDEPAADQPANGGFGFLPPPPPPPSGGPGRGPGDGPGRGAVVFTPQFGAIRISGSPQEGRMHLEASRISMAGLSDLLTGMTDRPVLDMTGLSGNFQVALEASMEEMFGGMARTQGLAFGPAGPGRGGPGGPGEVQGGGASDPSGNQVFASVAKLGLKLEARKAPVETIIVDHLEKMPTEN